MDPNHSPTGVRGRRIRGASDAELSFPAGLILPAQPQVTRYEDAVTDRVVRLDTHAQQLGEGFGIPYTSFELNPLPAPVTDSALVALASMMGALAHRAERISLERRGGRWGLYFTREPAVIMQERRSDTVPIKDAPLDVRERFLARSEAFFREYLELCKERLGRMQGAVTEADRTLQLLEQIRTR